jgi:hypothetical protein
MHGTVGQAPKIAYSTCQIIRDDLSSKKKSAPRKKKDNRVFFCLSCAIGFVNETFHLQMEAGGAHVKASAEFQVINSHICLDALSNITYLKMGNFPRSPEEEVLYAPRIDAAAAYRG